MGSMYILILSVSVSNNATNVSDSTKDAEFKLGK